MYTCLTIGKVYYILNYQYILYKFVSTLTKCLKYRSMAYMFIMFRDISDLLTKM